MSRLILIMRTRRIAVIAALVLVANITGAAGGLMSDDVRVNDLEAVGTFEGLRLCDQCLFVEARVTKVTARMLHGLPPGFTSMSARSIQV